MLMYSLTAMTGKEASASRTVVIGTVEFNWRVWMILLWTAPLGVIFAAIMWAVIGQLAIFTIPAVSLAALYLIHYRQKDGLRLATYQALWDKKKANTNQFFLCGVPIDVAYDDLRHVMSNVAPYIPVAKPAPVTFVTSLAPPRAEPDLPALPDNDLPPPVPVQATPPPMPSEPLIEATTGSATRSDALDLADIFDDHAIPHRTKEPQ